MYYQIPNNFLTQSLEAVTKSGATNTATITAVGGYDQVAVTGGNQTSFIKLNNVRRVNNNVTMKGRVRIDTLGTTACLLGFGWEGLNSSGDTGSAFANKMYVNFTSGVISAIKGVAGGPTALTTYASSGTVVSSGDVVEIIYTIDTIKGYDTLIILNEFTGKYIFARYTSNMANFPCQQANPSIVLGDGTFTILDWHFDPFVLAKPIIQLFGDSIGIGYNIPPADTIAYKLARSVPIYDIVDSCGNGCYIHCMENTGLGEVLKTKPHCVILFMYLSIYYGEFIDTDPNHATYMTSFNNIMSAIVNSGAMPTLIKIPSWPLDNGHTAAWNSFVDAQVIAYPTTLVLDLRPFTPTYDSSGYHYDGPFNSVVKGAIVDLMTTHNMI